MNGQKRPWSTLWEKTGDLGEGGQGQTFLVKEISQPERRGVLKTLRNNKSLQARGRMRMEVTNLETLSFENVKVPSVFSSNVEHFKNTDIPLYFVMEHIEGKTLKDVITSSGPLPLESAASLIFDLGRTITAAHNMAVFHRDLKPANIVVRNLEKADVVIVDYGLSFNKEDDESSLTIPGEQFRNEFLALPETNTPGGNKRDPRIDVTALCAVFYFCLTGQVPGQMVDGRGRAPHRREGNYSLRQFIPDARCSQIEVLLDRGFTLDIERRFQICGELTSRLSDILNAPKNKAQSPQAVAALLGQQLQERDRTTQLDTHRQASEQVLKVIHDKGVSAIAQKIAPFDVVNSGNAPITADQLPDGLDLVKTGRIVTVSLKHQQQSRVIRIGFGAAGNQTVMLLQTSSGGPKALYSKTDWDKAIWFSPQTMPSEEELVEIFNRYLTAAMQSLYDSVIPGGKTEQA
jgi:serine/threonine protein kinase